ncbi:MAG TPA: hypothetical protein VI111_09450 [Thermoleophilaceae bacterium]
MGRRSRKRADGAGPGVARPAATRAERDAARRARASSGSTERPPATRPSRARPGRPPSSERPQAPWGSFPLSELVILLGIIVLMWGFFSGERGQERIAAGLVLASLGGGELALREHLAGFRSHSALLAGVAALAAITVVALGLGTVKLWLLALVAVLVFGGSFYGLRELFKRRSGGFGFR